MKEKYDVVCLGGTFDRLHKGHEYFISRSVMTGKKIIIGLTSNQYVRNIKSKNNGIIPAMVQGYRLRKYALEEFLKRKKLISKCRIKMIDDVYGGAHKERNIDALCVTGDSMAGALKINKERVKFGLKVMSIVSIPLIKGQDSRAIASTRIRQGEIDRNGKLYLDLYFKGTIPLGLRRVLKKPLGRLIKGTHSNLQNAVGGIKKHILKTKPFFIITVGDEVTKVVKNSITKPHVSIIDFHVQRKRKYYSISDLSFKDGASYNILKVENPAGRIGRVLFRTVASAYHDFFSTGRSQIVKVEGEEDLAGVPAMLLAPLGSVVIYGQPNEGVVVVDIDEKFKEDLAKDLKGWL